jgi:MYXO-CTERM domain-containing protein
MPVLVSISGSSLGTGKGFAQIVPFDTTSNTMGTKDPQKLYEVSQFSDIAGTVVRGKRNPNDQGRGFIYAHGNIPNPGYQKGNTAFMPEVKSFIGSAVQGYTSATTAPLAARESIWLSLIPSSWLPNQPTTPGTVTPTPGTNPDGTGPLPRTNVPGTNTNPQTTPPPSVIPGGDSPQGPSGGAYGPGGNGMNSTAGCSVSTTGTSSGLGGLLLVGLGAFLGLRRSRKGGK